MDENIEEGNTDSKTGTVGGDGEDDYVTGGVYSRNKLNNPSKFI